MIQFVTVIHVIVCVLLIIVVLLQQGKKDGMGAAFGGGSSSVFGARGAETFLEKLTKVLAIVFMCTSLSLVYFASRTSSDSLLSDEKPAQEAPVNAGTPAAPVGETAPVENAETPAPSVETAKPVEKTPTKTPATK